MSLPLLGEFPALSVAWASPDMLSGKALGESRRVHEDKVLC